MRGVARDVSDLAQGEIEADLLATNAALHAHVALSLLNRSIHLFVKKPLAELSEDARAMVKAAARSPAAVLAVGLMRRFLFVNRWVKMLIEHSALGNVESFDVCEGDGLAEFLPSKRRLDLYAAKCVVRIDKARHVLGYEPEFELERGMGCTTRYVRWAYGHRVQGQPPTA